jgi:hypothetical protein
MPAPRYAEIAEHTYRLSGGLMTDGFIKLLDPDTSLSRPMENVTAACLQSGRNVHQSSFSIAFWDYCFLFLFLYTPFDKICGFDLELETQHEKSYL